MSRVENKQRGFARLVDTRNQASSNKNYLNILKDEYLKGRVEPITRSDDKSAGIL